MDCQKFEENNKCRICLEEDVIVDWNNYLQNHDHLTYKDCYYKYTQLDCFDVNNLYLSTMLCRNCSNGLENINEFITKAIETHDFLKERLALHTEYKEENEKDLETNFETILMSETIDIKPEVENLYLYEASDEESSIKHNSMFLGPNKECLIDESNSYSINEDDQSSKKHGHGNEATSKECLSEESDAWSITDGNGINESKPNRSRKRKSMKEECEKDTTKSSTNELQSDAIIPKKKHSSKRWEIPTCCSICPKVLNSKYKAIEHEQTHLKNRERNEVCTECGMKFYNKTALRCHMRTHIENREKTHKCEFCDKAFYNSGGLNIHRRIHLGQMIKCTLCTKEFFRQVDLDKHMISHSVTKISGDLKVKKKYFVHCEICEVSVRSTQYKAHSAKHMNEPLAKCTICEKEFFSKNSCNTHVKKVHKIGNGERSNYIIAYKTTYYSNLFLQQNVGTIFTKD